MEKTISAAIQPFLLLPTPKEAEDFDVHVFYGPYSLLLKKTFFKKERGRKRKIEISAVRDLVDFLKKNCKDSKKAAEEIERSRTQKGLIKCEIGKTKCGFEKYPRPEEMVRWNTAGNCLEEKMDSGDWIESKFLNSIQEETETKKTKKMKSLIKGLQAALISDIGDIRYSYLAATNPESAYIGLDSKGRRYYDPDKLKKIFFEMDLLKSLAMAVGYDYRNIPAPDILLLKWF